MSSMVLGSRLAGSGRTIAGAPSYRLSIGDAAEWLFPGSGTGRPVVARRSEVGWAHAAHDVLDDVEVALATIEVHFASLFPPFSSCVSSHRPVKMSITHHANASRTTPRHHASTPRGRRSAAGVGAWQAEGVWSHDHGHRADERHW
jgi:hypothetical protein